MVLVQDWRLHQLAVDFEIVVHVYYLICFLVDHAIEVQYLRLLCLCPITRLLWAVGLLDLDLGIALLVALLGQAHFVVLILLTVVKGSSGEIFKSVFLVSRRYLGLRSICVEIQI